MQRCFRFALTASVSLVFTLAVGPVKAQSFGVKSFENATNNVTGANGVSPTPKDDTPIDRYALVERHNIRWNTVTGQIPLGNGEFAFNADGTGLQTFGGNSMSHWGWHSFPLPAGVTAAQVPPTGTFEQGRVDGPDVASPPGTEAIRQWISVNPHIMNLGRLRLCKADGTALEVQDISSLTRTLDLWSGVQTSTYQVGGQPVQVETCVNPTLDAVVVRIESPLIAQGDLQVALDFPYPSLTQNQPWVGDFSRVEGNKTEMTKRGIGCADFVRSVDAMTYDVSLNWSAGCQLGAPEAANRFILSARGTNRLELTCAFSFAPISGKLPTVEESFQETSNHWQNFWSTGGAIDLSGSKDPRWFELERRIVLSEYEMAAQSAGRWPSAEGALTGIDPWSGRFHMEMVWWHEAHFALWDRWSLAEKALGCYERFTPVAKALAEQLGYQGLKWGKSVGPNGRTAPWKGNQVLLWKEPHPIFFAELDYRLHPTQATLEKWKDIVTGTAEHMADYPTRDPKTGIYSLAFVMPPSEKGVWSNTVFDLAYWRWGLNQAQIWRQRLGLTREPHWDEVLTNLAPLPVANGVFILYPGATNTYTTSAYEHPDPIGVYGMLPPIAGVDPLIAHNTVLKLWSTWNWNATWGWDCPWMAMAAARTGEPQMAVDALLKNSARNHFDQRGLNNGGPCPYLPGNGGLLYAVAMMAAGWDGCPARPAPGFPNDGSWTVKWEGLKKAP